MSESMLARVIDAMHRTIESHTVELNALDEAIGDGDHGTNLAKGFAAVAAQKGEIAGLPLGAALRRIGGILEQEVGGDSGALYGALFTGMGEAASERAPSPAELAAMLKAAAAAVQAKGGAKKGDKTMLDVLIPVAQTYERLVAEGRADDQPGARLVAAAAHGLHTTTQMQAKRGQAADLGVASVNRLDPGACSCALLIGAVVGVLEPEPKTA